MPDAVSGGGVPRPSSSATRRPGARHPLSEAGGSLEEAVRRERLLMAPVRDRADFVHRHLRTYPPPSCAARLLRLFGRRTDQRRA
ncbi:MAG: hypothetical protein ACLSHM_01420 [Vescimonas sp.]